MPAIYEVEFELDDFQTLTTRTWDASLTVDQMGTPLQSLWKPPEVFVPMPKRPRPDIWSLDHYELLIFEPAALQTLQSVVSSVGEWLPLPFGNVALTVLNVLYRADCIDVERSECFEFRPNQISKPEIDPDRIAHSLFRIPKLAADTKIYATEGVFPPEVEFKSLVEKHALSGLWFRKIWEGNAPTSAKSLPAKAARKKPTKPKAARRSAPRKKKPKKKD